MSPKPDKLATRRRIASRASVDAPLHAGLQGMTITTRLFDWSVSNESGEFWVALCEFCDVRFRDERPNTYYRSARTTSWTPAGLPGAN